MNKLQSPAMFIADSRGLDFLNSIATPDDTPVDWIATGADFLAWLQDAGLVSADVAGEVERAAVPGELDAVAAQARSLREWFRGFVMKHRGKPLKKGALQELEPLNRLLARDDEFKRLVLRSRDHAGEGTSPITLRLDRRWRSPDSLLLPIAHVMAELVCDSDFADVGACEGPDCTLLFLDRTRRGARRWCSMAICGNRAKQAAHRSRSARQ